MSRRPIGWDFESAVIVHIAQTECKIEKRAIQQWRLRRRVPWFWREKIVAIAERRGEVLTASAFDTFGGAELRRVSMTQMLAALEA